MIGKEREEEEGMDGWEDKIERKKKGMRQEVEKDIREKKRVIKKYLKIYNYSN